MGVLFSVFAYFYNDQVYMCSIGEIMGSESWEKKADNLVSNLPSGILSIEWKRFLISSGYWKLLLFEKFLLYR